MRTNRLPTKESLETLLSYNPQTGDFFWKYCKGRKDRIGKLAGSVKGINRYREIFVCGRLYKAHRLAFVFMEVEIPEFVDHVNGCKSDNRWSNLRPASSADNVRNCWLRKDSTTKLKGTSYHKASGKYGAKIQVCGKRIWLGLYGTPEEAYVAYCEAAKKYHGEFANLGDKQ